LNSLNLLLRAGLFMDKKIIMVNIAISALIIVIVAMIGADIISYCLSRLFTGPLDQAKSPPQAVARRDLAVYAPILEKGLFGPATRGGLTPITGANGKDAASPGDLILLGTAVGSYRETFVLVRRQSTGEEKVFRLGDKVFDLGPLVTVRHDTAVIGTVTLHAPMSVPGASDGKQASAVSVPGLANQVSSGSYVVDQRALSSALDNAGQAMTDARLLPSVKEGKVEGFRVSEVKPGGIFAMVGIGNGDTILRINDFSIDSPGKAMQSLMSLKGQSRIKVDLVREGKPTTLTYDIR
jgi:general secretion pathway protein C